MMETGETISGANEVSIPDAPRKRSRKRSMLIFTVVTLINIGLLTLLWTQLLTPAHQSSSQTASDPLIGSSAPNFSLPVLNHTSGQQLSLANFKGKGMVINFWSSTCQPCQAEMPLLETQWERVQSQGIIFLGIDVEDTTRDGLAFMQKYGATYTSVIDSTGGTLVDYGVTYTPETIFIDRTGKVISAVRMQVTSQQLTNGLQKLLQT
ncbi:MAG TPA: TlpA disulfide reductase family protein [Ktedonobacteraceae bacterium]